MWAAVVVLLLLIIGGFIINQSKAQRTADCVNTVLGERDKITGKLHEADVMRVEAQNRAESVKTKALKDLAAATDRASSTQAFADYSRGEALFQKTLRDYVATSNRIRQEQLDTPLGKC